ncbi:periodic tryptophan protein 1 homolog [Acanthaster planci]|uniref:Periodic tryptophan protein 1 homolog n=1 Tax=Acanthaster planci TaxID=133434 RepID=A0A8B7XEQ0_ACAPL|nr:periodic tryptophan protein 1 homolog [Acanthaster planci]
MTSSIITCLAWVPQGAAKENPEKVQMNSDDIQALVEKSKPTHKRAAELSDEGASGSNEVTQSGVTMETEDDLAEYDLDNYDSPDSDTGGQDSFSGLAMFASNRDDPYMTLQEDEEDRDDLEDLVIQPRDNLIVAGRAQEDASCLEVYVYNEDEGTLYVHHDILLPSFPLAAEWMNFNPKDSTPGNYVAMGYMTPVIDVWNLDVVDCLEPAFTLGKRKKKSKKKAPKPTEGHTDAVLDIAWNRHVRHGLASASADNTIALWDMAQQKVLSLLTHHSDKVQTVAWHPFEAQSLASGSFDMSVKVFDCRSAHDSFKTWSLDGEIERVIWDLFQPFHFLASTDKGNVYCMDVRTDKPVFTLKAHDDAVTALSLSTEVPSCLVTASADHLYKVWDIKDNKPSLIVSKDPKMGTVNCVHCSPNSPFIFAVGGERDGMRLVDVTSHAPVHRQFSKRRRRAAQETPALVTNQSTSMHQPGSSHTSEMSVETDTAGFQKPGAREVKSTKKSKKQPPTT